MPPALGASHYAIDGTQQVFGAEYAAPCSMIYMADGGSEG